MEATAKWAGPLFKTITLVENSEEILCIVYSRASNYNTWSHEQIYEV